MLRFNESALAVCLLSFAAAALAQSGDTDATASPGLRTLAPYGDQKTGLWITNYGTRRPFFDFDNVQFRPWAKGLFDARQQHDLEPHARCKASGAVRQFLTPYGVEIVEIPELQVLYIFDIGGPHTFREVYMDGRSHPTDLMPTNYGHNIGWWDGDTLVVDTVGFLPGALVGTTPHSDALHVVERFTLDSEAKTLRREYRAEDPLFFTAPYAGGETLIVSNVPYDPEPCVDLTPLPEAPAR